MKTLSGIVSSERYWCCFTTNPLISASRLVRHLLGMALALTGGVSAGEFEWNFDFTDPVSNKLVWQSNTGINYNVSHSANLSTWLPDDGFPKAGTGGWMELSFTAVSNGFFKIVSEAAIPSEFVLIPAGGIQVGDTFGDGASDERPVFTLYNIDAFSIGRYEVTKSLWDDLRAWSITNGYTNLPTGAAKALNHPVGSVSWHAVVKWCNARSEKEGLTPCYTVNGAIYRNGEIKSPTCNRASSGYRLPTEVEWEKAARGGSAGHRFPWTDTDEITHSRANYNSTGALFV
jgi:formylglycine-generating enzyme required for sulfatase activity